MPKGNNDQAAVEAENRRIEHVGEAATFATMVGGEAELWALCEAEKPNALGAWWNGRAPHEQLYLVQYLRPKAHWDFLVCPNFYTMAEPARAELHRRLQAVGKRALAVLREHMARVEQQRGYVA